MASSVGCSAEPEVTLLTLQPHVDRFLIIASDGVWDVQTNEQVCQLVAEAMAPEAACQKILDTCLYEWEEKLSADNISVVVAMFEWEE
jgi:serine/threonine protein phosphatase PrpC